MNMIVEIASFSFFLYKLIQAKVLVFDYCRGIQVTKEAYGRE